MGLCQADRKSTRLKSSHIPFSRFSFCFFNDTATTEIYTLSLHDALPISFDPLTVESRHFDHKAYYPGARRVCVRLTGDRRTSRLLGAQILGPRQAEVSKRVDIYATALYHGMTIEALNDLDLSYTPPLGSPWDAVQMAAQAWSQIAKSEG